MKVCAVFCEDQKRALQLLSNKQRDNKDQRIAQILQVTHTAQFYVTYLHWMLHTRYEAVFMFSKAVIFQYPEAVN